MRIEAHQVPSKNHHKLPKTLAELMKRAYKAMDTEDMMEERLKEYRTNKNKFQPANCSQHINNQRNTTLSPPPTDRTWEFTTTKNQKEVFLNLKSRDIIKTLRQEYLRRYWQKLFCKSSIVKDIF